MPVRNDRISVYAIDPMNTVMEHKCPVCEERKRKKRIYMRDYMRKRRKQKKQNAVPA